MNPDIAGPPRYMQGHRLPRSINITRWRTGLELFVTSQRLVGATAISLGRPDVAGNYLSRCLRTVQHSAIYVLFLRADCDLCDALEVERSHQTDRPMALTSLEMEVRLREIVKVSMHTFASSIILVLNNATGDEDNRHLSAHFHEMLVEPLRIIDVRIADHFWIEESQTYSWLSSGKPSLLATT